MSTPLQYAGSALSVIWSTIKYTSYFYVINTYVIPVKLAICRGSSMEPTLRNNDILLTENVTVRKQKLRE